MLFPQTSTAVQVRCRHWVRTHIRRRQMSWTLTPPPHPRSLPSVPLSRVIERVVLVQVLSTASSLPSVSFPSVTLEGIETHPHPSSYLPSVPFVILVGWLKESNVGVGIIISVLFVNTAAIDFISWGWSKSVKDKEALVSTFYLLC